MTTTSSSTPSSSILDVASIVTPWTPTHVSKANEQRTNLSLALDRAIEAQDWQLVSMLTHSIHALDSSINGFYGR